MIAIALACSPKLLVADEPTTALDVTIQAEILDLLRRLQEEFRMGVLLITRNLGVVAEFADRLTVMYAGRAMEQGPVEPVFASPGHPYTVGLLRSIPPRAHRLDPPGRDSWQYPARPGPAAASRRAALTPPRLAPPRSRRCGTSPPGA